MSISRDYDYKDRYNINIVQHRLFDNPNENIKDFISDYTYSELRKDGFCVFSMNNIHEEYMIDLNNFSGNIDFITGVGDRDKISLIREIVRHYKLKMIVD